MPAIEMTLMTEPGFAIIGRKTFSIRSGPSTLICICRSIAWDWASMKGPGVMTPALLTMTLMLATLCRISPATAAIEPGSARSHSTAVTAVAEDLFRLR